MRKLLIAAMLLSVSLHAQSRTIKPNKEEQKQVKKHEEVAAKMVKMNAPYQRTLWGIEQWMAAQHPGYSYDTTLDLFVEIPKAPPPAVEAPKPEAKP